MKLNDLPLPKVKTMMGKRYKIKEVPDKFDSEGQSCWGETDSEGKKITVAKNSPDKYGVYFHECLHAVDEISSILEGCTDEEEKLAHKLLEAHAKFFSKEANKILNLGIKIGLRSVKKHDIIDP